MSPGSTVISTEWYHFGTTAIVVASITTGFFNTLQPIHHRSEKWTTKVKKY